MTKRYIIFALLVFSFSSIYVGCTNKSVEPTISHLIVSDIPQSFSAPFGGPSPSQLFFTITSSTDQVFNYSISNKSNWLFLINSKQTLIGFTPDSISFMIRVASPTTLAQGTYYDTITIVTDSSSQDVFEKEIILTIGSEISAVPSSFEFDLNLNEINPKIIELDINSSSSVPFDFTLSNTASWLTVPSITYNTSDTAKILVSVSGVSLPKGINTDTIWVTSDSALNSPYPVPVTVEVKSWLPQKSPILSNINDIYFTDAQNGWAVGDVIDVNTKSGFIIKTADGGEHWEEVRFLSTTKESDSLLGGITFIDNKGWAVGVNNIIMYSNNYGNDWSFQTPPSNFNFNDVFFISADSGWIVGDSVVLSTSDGGIKWVKQNTPIQQKFTSISFIDNMHGWVSGLTDVILVTTDGGVNWKTQTVPPGPGTVGNKYDFQEIIFTDALHGWAVGKFGLVVLTVNGGTTWMYEQIPQEPRLLSVYFVNASTGWITGQDGLILHTTNGGISWTIQFIETTSLLQSIFFIDEDNGWVVGGDGTIFYTASGGE